MAELNVYQRLNAARLAFHATQLRKTGKNTFAGYNYFELADFLVPALRIFAQHGLAAVVSFPGENAVMVITNIDAPDDRIILESPMGSANLKGCHEVQNIGAVQTYQRRYLWTAALEIVEHDALEATTGKPGAKGVAGGQSEGRAVSPRPEPDTPANDGAQARAKGWREPSSPLSTPTKLHAELARLERELAGCGDSDMVYALCGTDEWREFARVAEIHAPHYLHGGDPAPPEFKGLLKLAERRVADFDSNTANHMADLARA